MALFETFLNKSKQRKKAIERKQTNEQFCEIVSSVLPFFKSITEIMNSNKPTGDVKPDQQEKRKKESILELSKFLEKSIRVKFAGGREASGILKGFDPLLNIVLDNTIEYLRDPDDPYKLTDDTRQLGLVVCRGPNVMMISPQDGMEPIANPFASSQE